MEQPATQKIKVPHLVIKNTALLALAQSFTGAGMQLGYGVGPLMVVALTGSASLAGISVGLFALSRFLVAYPAGWITDTFGRKPGIMLGLVLALAGTLAIGFAMELGSVAALVGGFLLFGMGMNVAKQLRVAAADMFPHFMRAQALGYVATGSLLGLLITPILIAVAEVHAPRVGFNPLSLPWFMLPGLIVSGMAMVFFIKPDPKYISHRLDLYYPGYTPPVNTTHDAGSPQTMLWANVRTRAALIANTAAQANMSIVMVLTSMMLHHHGHSLAIIGLSHMFHSAGMFAFTLPLGWLADRIGREKVMYSGVVATMVGAGLITAGNGFVTITLGTFLVGIGWAGANVAATAIIADAAGPSQRGRAIGFSDTLAALSAVFAAVITGPMIEILGLAAAGIAAAVIALPPVVTLAFRRARSA